jgi:hypothetical protein
VSSPEGIASWLADSLRRTYASYAQKHLAGGGTVTIRARGVHIGKAVSLAEHVKRSATGALQQTVTVDAITEKGQEAAMTIVLAPSKPGKAK